MRFLIVADGLGKLNPHFDTGLALLREGLMRGHEMHWAIASGAIMSISELQFQSNQVLSCEPDELPEIGPASQGPLSDFDGVWIRKDPPFDESYVALCWALLLEKDRVPIFNPPERLLQLHEKLIPLLAVSSGELKESDILQSWIPGTSSALPPSDWKGKSHFITKPLLGHGGRGVRQWKTLQAALESFREEDWGRVILQPYQPQIVSEGDRRVFFLNGEVKGCVARLPQEGSIVSNRGAGGKVVPAKLSSQETECSERLGKFLKKNSIVLAGADLIGGKINEVNITAPTLFRELKEIDGVDLAAEYLNYAESCASHVDRANPAGHPQED